MKFIIDTQLPPRLSRFLETQGFDSVHTTSYPNGHLLTDREIMEIAERENRIVVTKDSDFMDHFLLIGPPPQVLLLTFGNIGNSDLVALFQQELSAIRLLFENGASLVVFSRTNLVSY